METGHDVVSGSARVSRAGDGFSPSRNFRDMLIFEFVRKEKFVVAGRDNQHARRVRYAEPAAAANLQPAYSP